MGNFAKFIAAALCFAALIAGSKSYAQFGSGLQGTVRDSSGAVVQGASITLRNVETQVTQSAKADSNGDYRFTSLAPGKYEVAASMTGFSEARTIFDLTTNQTQNVALVLRVGNVSAGVEVTTQAPLLDTAESRNQLTLDSKQLNDLPLPTRNPLALLSLTPGVTGLGAGAGTTFFGSSDKQLVSANGRGQNGNQYIVDGLDVTSDVRPGVTDLIPNADAIQELNVQTNTYTVDYGRASSIQTVMTTKSGTEKYHGFASEYYKYQGLAARGEFGVPQPAAVTPTHVNNMSFGVGGPVIPHHEFFFFASLEPYLAHTLNSTGLVTFEDPAFVAFAQQVQPTTPETGLLTKYQPTGATFRNVLQTASQAFGIQNTAANTGCQTPSTDNIPCSLAVTDQGNYNSVAVNRSKQYSFRLDKYFSKDRLYGTFFRDTVVGLTPGVRDAFPTSETDFNYAIQGNETHTFSSSLLNEAAVGFIRLEGIGNILGGVVNTVPRVNVTALGTGFGNPNSGNDFYQSTFHWRDTLSFNRARHSIKAGYEGFHGTNNARFAGSMAIPLLTYKSLINFINDNIFSESSLSYDPLTGLPKPFNRGYAKTTGGAFVEDTWRVTQRLTVNYGIRYDDFGNTYATLAGTTTANFYPAASGDFPTQIANGVLKIQDKIFPHSINYVFSPRIGIALDPTGSAKWAIRGGFGLYHDEYTLGNGSNTVSMNPPNVASPTFFQTGTLGKPAFGFGTSNTYPYGFQYPAFQAQALDSKGGIVGQQLSINGVDANLKPPSTLAYSATVERQIGPSVTASVGYVGSYSTNLIVNGSNTNLTFYGLDVNTYAGDLLQHPNFTPKGAYAGTGTLTRLNTSFGSIGYSFNGARQSYNALTATVRGRLTKRGFLVASYTRALAKDNWGMYPTPLNLNQYYSNSPFDVRNRFSAGYSYDLPGLRGGNGFVGRVTSGFVLSGTTILQSGTPFTVSTNAPLTISTTAKDGVLLTSTNYAAELAAGNLQFAPTSGDFNADGLNYDYPVVANYRQGHTRSDYKTGVFGPCTTGIYTCGQFSQPTVGAEGNELPNSFRDPGYASTDLTLKKLTKIAEVLTLELRFDAFNVFNRVNFNGVDGNLPDGKFGQVSGTNPPRIMQLGAKLSF